MYSYQVIDVTPDQIQEAPGAFQHGGVSKQGKDWRIALITSDHKPSFNRSQEAAKIGALLKVTSKFGPAFKEFKANIPGVPVPQYFKQNIDGQEVFGWGYWMTKPEEEQPVLQNISKIVSWLNQQEKNGAGDVSYGSPEDLPQLKDAFAVLRRVASEVAQTGTQTTKEVLDAYIEQLASSLDDEKLLNDIAEFNRIARTYIFDTGKYSYSIGNTFLIWLQADKKANEFGPEIYWKGRGYQPKKDARKIFILKPSGGQSVTRNFAWLKQNKPEALKAWNKETGKPENTPIPKEKEYAVVVFAMKHGMLPTKFQTQFHDVPIYDNLNVEPIPGVQQVDQPEGLKWFNDDNNEDDKATVMYEALKAFCAEVGIKITHEDDLGGAQGTSSNSSSHIQLLTKSPGAGLLSTFVHELAHQLLHSPVNAKMFGGKYYVGRENTREERELHAEAIAFTVMKSFGFPIEHSINYLAMWKSDKDKVKKYQKIIRDTSFFIIQQIEKFGSQMAQGQTTEPTVGEPETTPADELMESLNLMASMIREFQEGLGGEDLVAKVDALEAAFANKAQAPAEEPAPEAAPVAETEQSILEKYKVNVIQVAENKRKNKS